MFGGSVDFFLKPILGDQTQKKQSMVNLEDEKAGTWKWCFGSDDWKTWSIFRWSSGSMLVFEAVRKFGNPSKLGGGNSNMFLYVRPEPWGNDSQFDETAYFSNGWEKTSTVENQHGRKTRSCIYFKNCGCWYRLIIVDHTEMKALHNVPWKAE